MALKKLDPEKLLYPDKPLSKCEKAVLCACSLRNVLIATLASVVLLTSCGIFVAMIVLESINTETYVDDLITRATFAAQKNILDFLGTSPC